MALTDNLVSYWKLDETGGIRTDSHGDNTLSVSFAGVVGSDTGILSNAALFDGSAFLSVIGNTSLRVTGAFTLSAWAQFPTLPAGGTYNTVVGKWESGGAEFVLYYTGDTQKFTIEVSPNGGASTVNVSSANTYTAINTWYHIVARYDEDTLGISVNGSVFNTISYSAGIYSGTSRFYIGNPGYNGNYWIGLIDEVGFWQRALSDGEVAALYNSGAGLAYPFGLTPPTHAPAIQLNSESDYLTRDTLANIMDHRGQYTFMCWVKVFQYNATGKHIFQISNAIYNNHDVLGWGNYGGGLGVSTSWEGTPDGSFGTNIETWYHAAIVRESPTSLKLYGNGTFIAEVTADQTGRGAPSQMGIGGYANGQGGGIPTQIAFAKLWTAALTAEEIAAEVNCIAPVKTDDTWAYYLFEDGALGVDASGNGRDWTITGTPISATGPTGIADCSAQGPSPVISLPTLRRGLLQIRLLQRHRARH